MATLDATTEINGRTYFVVQMPPTKAVVVQMRLTKILGGSLRTLLPAIVPGASKDHLSRSVAVAGAIGSLFEAATEQELSDLIFDVVRTAKVDGKPIDIDTSFRGEYLMDLYKVFLWVLGVNYGSFFGEGGLDAWIAKFKVFLAAEMQTPSAPKSPETAPQT